MLAGRRADPFALFSAPMLNVVMALFEELRVVHTPVVDRYDRSVLPSPS